MGRKESGRGRKLTSPAKKTTNKKTRRGARSGHRARRRQAAVRTRKGYDPTPEERRHNLQRAYDWCQETGKGATAAFRHFAQDDAPLLPSQVRNLQLHLANKKRPKVAPSESRQVLTGDEEKDVVSYLILLNRYGTPLDQEGTSALVLDMLRLRRDNNKLPPSQRGGPCIPLSAAAIRALDVGLRFVCEMFTLLRLPVLGFGPSWMSAVPKFCSVVVLT